MNLFFQYDIRNYFDLHSNLTYCYNMLGVLSWIELRFLVTSLSWPFFKDYVP